MIRCAKENDLPEILRIYEYARGFMARTGNPNQWTGGHPREELLRGEMDRLTAQMNDYQRLLGGGETPCKLSDGN